MKAMWNNQVIAESKYTIFVENNHYFPIESVDKKFLKSNKTKSMCWKGEATYFDILVDEEINKDSAWTYLNPVDEVQIISGYVAFWRGVKIFE